jgi:flagellar biosynthesis/type III secretory pathway protein FliH
VLSARQEKEHDIDQDDQELIMKLSEMYEQQLAEIKKQEREEGEQQGLQKGRQEGLARERRAMIESILQVRFGELDSELATIIDQVIAMTREEFTPLLLQLSREELLARFTN